MDVWGDDLFSLSSVCDGEVSLEQRWRYLKEDALRRILGQKPFNVTQSQKN